MTNILQKQRGNAVYTANQANKTSYFGQETSALQPNSSTGPRRSLNRDARKRELMKITKENQLILKRLQDKSANYNVSKWQKEDNERIKILKNICEFPLVQKEMYMQPDFIIKKKKSSSAHNVANYKKKGYASGNGPLSMQSQANQIIKKESLYVGTHELGNGFYQIEILLS